MIWAELDFCHETTTHFYPPPFSRDELLIFILYFDSPFFCFQQVDFKVERLQTISSLCLLLCAELTFFHFLLLKADMSTERTLSDWACGEQLGKYLYCCLYFRQNVKCFTFSYQRKKPNFFLTLICFRNVRKHRRSMRKLLGAILCKTFPSPQSIVGRTFRNFWFCGELLEKYLQKRKLISQKQLILSLSRVDTKFWFSTSNNFEDLPLFFFLSLWTTVCKLKLAWGKVLF